MKKLHIVVSGIIISTALPVLVFAAPADIQGLVDLIIGYIKQIIPIVVLLIVLYFFWGVANFIRTAGDGKEREKAKEKIFWGVVALFVTFSFWGIVQLLSSDLFGIKPDLISPQIDTKKIMETFPRK